MSTADTVLSSGARAASKGGAPVEVAVWLEAGVEMKAQQTSPLVNDCLSDDEIVAFVSGDVSERLLERIDAHVDRCEQCFEIVQVATPDHELIEGSQRFGGLALRPGSLVAGRYRIRRFVDRGGMGEVYEALDLKLNERVALKTVLCTAGDSRHAVRKLFAEVQLARRIAHRHVCRIYELHEHTEPDSDWPPVHFLTMEFIEGEKLARHLSNGPLPLAEAAIIARQLLLGLQAAHAAGVLHLDFKSDNVMLRAGSVRPEAIVMDFGLARALDAQSRMRTSEQKQLAGSVAYMAPEQVECQPVLGEAADIYAFGVVLFEMLTGRLPFEGPSAAAVMLKRLKLPAPAPSSFEPEVPKALDEFVLVCLQRDPRRRYAEAGSALTAFEVAMLGVAPAPSRGRLLALAGVGVALAAGVAAFTMFDGTVGAELSGPSDLAVRSLEPAPKAGPESVSTRPKVESAPHHSPSDAPQPDRSENPSPKSAASRSTIGAAPTSAAGATQRGARVNPNPKQPNPTVKAAAPVLRVAPQSQPGQHDLVHFETAAPPQVTKPPVPTRRAPGLPGAPPRLR